MVERSAGKEQEKPLQRALNRGDFLRLGGAGFLGLAAMALPPLRLDRHLSRRDR